MVGVPLLEQAAMKTGEANQGELRIRAYQQINASNVICDYTVRGTAVSRADAISYVGTGKTLRERGFL